MRQDLEYVHHLFACDMKIDGNILVYFLTQDFNRSSAKLSITMLLSGSNQTLRKIKLLANVKAEPTDNETLLEVNPHDGVFSQKIRNIYSKTIEEHQWHFR